MAGKGLGAVPSFQKFLLRKNVMELWRDVHRTIRGVDDKDYVEFLTIQARERFRNHQTESDEYEIRVLTTRGRNELESFRRVMECAPDLSPREGQKTAM